MRFPRPLPIAIGLTLSLLTGVADATSTTCATSTVCAEFINSSSGVAIHGEANSGIGIRGTSNTSTGFYGATRSGNILFPGVDGESLNNNGYDAAATFGVAGHLVGVEQGTLPAEGVIADGQSVGVTAYTENPGTIPSPPTSDTVAVTGAAIYGEDYGGHTNDNDGNAGIFGSSAYGAAMVGLANTQNVETGGFGTAPIGVLGDAEPQLAARGAIGVEGISDYTPVAAYNPQEGARVLLASQIDQYGDFYDLLAQNGNTFPFSVDASGNIAAASLVTTKGMYARTTGSSGTARTLYAPHTTSPVTEDFGEAQLVDGRGYVRLDPALADVIDNRNAYHVFLTPEGDSNGLYVTQKSAAGFLVREAHGGRSTMAFEYRILAKPVDENGVRLAIASPLPHPVAPLVRHARTELHNAPTSLPLDPFVRLKRKLGAAGYARAIAAVRQNLNDR